MGKIFLLHKTSEGNKAPYKLDIEGVVLILSRHGQVIKRIDAVREYYRITLNRDELVLDILHFAMEPRLFQDLERFTGKPNTGVSRSSSQPDGGQTQTGPTQQQVEWMRGKFTKHTIDVVCKELFGGEG